jgi:hypothetical protein
MFKDVNVALVELLDTISELVVKRGENKRKRGENKIFLN